LERLWNWCWRINNIDDCLGIVTYDIRDELGKQEADQVARKLRILAGCGKLKAHIEGAVEVSRIGVQVATPLLDDMVDLIEFVHEPNLPNGLKVFLPAGLGAAVIVGKRLKKADVIDDLHRATRGGGPRPAVVSNLPEIGRKARAILVSKLGPHNFPPQAAAQAHHIFPVDLFLEPIGRKLSNLGIDLNGAENGVWLPKFNYPGRKASIHNGRTCGSYIDKIRQLFDAAETNEDALAILRRLREDLVNGKLLINGATGVRLQMSRVP
jgi:hypothetical protein